MSETAANVAEVIGLVKEPLEFSHTVYKENFYKTKIEVLRDSGKYDEIRIIVPERITDVGKGWAGRMVAIIGEFRSYNRREGGKSRLELFLFAKAFQELGEGEDGYWNKVTLSGYICKPVIYRKTPLGREISDILLAVNRPYGKSDCIPCICWGRNARFADSFEIGGHIQVQGRIQSREYQKQSAEEKYETKTAYEVSVSELEVIESEGHKDQVADAE